MSMDRCSKCHRPVDTDRDCDFYQSDAEGYMTYGLCEGCREEAEQQALTDDPGYSHWLDTMESEHGHSHGH